jgi:hypothetical protein
MATSSRAVLIIAKTRRVKVNLLFISFGYIITRGQHIIKIPAAGLDRDIIIMIYFIFVVSNNAPGVCYFNFPYVDIINVAVYTCAFSS